MVPSPPLTYLRIFVFWLPLALSWLMMAVEGPFVAAIIARLADPKLNLAAHGVAFSFALLIEAPVIMLTAATTSLCKDRVVYHKLHRFVILLNLSVTLAMLVILIPAVFDTVMRDLMELPAAVSELIHQALLLLLPWPASIGYRRFYQGILIRHNLPRRISYGTLIRLCAMAFTGFGLYFTQTTGVIAGASALSAGVMAEALAIRWMVHHTLKKLKLREPSEADLESPVTYHRIWVFYYPLALMVMLTLGVHPMISFFMGRSRMPVESLAVLPVLNALVFIFRAIGLSYQEAVIKLLENSRENYLKLRNFAVGMSIFLVSGLGIIAYSPLVTVWFHQISGLSNELTAFAELPVRILAIFPGFSVLLTLQWGIMIHVKRTHPISLATAIEVIFIGLTLFVCIAYLDFIGVTAAAISYLLGRSLSVLFMMPHQFRAVSQFR